MKSCFEPDSTKYGIDFRNLLANDLKIEKKQFSKLLNEEHIRSNDLNKPTAEEREKFKIAVQQLKELFSRPRQLIDDNKC